MSFWGLFFLLIMSSSIPLRRGSENSVADLNSPSIVKPPYLLKQIKAGSRESYEVYMRESA